MQYQISNLFFALAVNGIFFFGETWKLTLPTVENRRERPGKKAALCSSLFCKSPAMCALVVDD